MYMPWVWLLINIQAFTKRMLDNSCNRVPVAASMKRRVHKRFARGGQGRACELHGAACASSTPVYEVMVMESYVFRAAATTTCVKRTDAAASDQRRRHVSTQKIVLE